MQANSSDPSARMSTALLASVAALTSLSIDMSLPAVPSIERSFRLLAGGGGLSMSVFLAGYALTPLVGGPMSDRFGRKPLLWASLGLFTMAALVCSIAPTFQVLLLFRFLQGCASGVSTTLPLAIIRDLMSGAAARKGISEVTVINNLMPIVAPLLGSVLMNSGSWRVVFAIQAVFATCLLLASPFVLVESLVPERRQHLSLRSIAGNYGKLLKAPAFFRLAMVNGLTFACIFCFVSLSPMILIHKMRVSHHLYPVLFAMVACGSIFGSVVSSFLSRGLHSARGVILSGLLLMLTASGLAALLQLLGLNRPIFFLPPMIVTLFGFGLLTPSVTAGAVEPVPHLAGSGSGALRSILMLCGSGASALLTAFCTRYPLNAEIATTSTMLLLVLGACGLYLL